MKALISSFCSFYVCYVVQVVKFEATAFDTHQLSRPEQLRLRSVFKIINMNFALGLSSEDQLINEIQSD